MGQFEYGRVLSRLMTPVVVRALGDVREHGGKQVLYIATKPDALERLCETARFRPASAAATPVAVERLLQKMQAEGYIEKAGAVRSTCYRRVDSGNRASANCRV